MNDAELLEIARQCAKAKPQSYYAEPFQPHEWVIDAMRAVQTKLVGNMVPCRHEFYQGVCHHCELTAREFRSLIPGVREGGL